MGQRSGNGRHIGRIKNLAISLWKEFSKYRDARREECFCSKKVSLEEQTAQKEDRILRGRQIAFMIYDYYFRSHFGSSHFLFERARFFSRSRAFLVLSCPSAYNPVSSFPPFPMARGCDGTDVPVSPLPAFSSNIGSPNGSLPDLERTGSRSITMEEKINEIYLQLPLFLQNASRIENCVQSLSQTVSALATWITSVDQIVDSLAARVATMETNATSVSSGSGSAELLEFTWTNRQPRGPVAQDHLTTTGT